jgi:hypothetical protein
MLITLFTYHYGILPLFTQNISFKSSNSNGSNTTDRLNCFFSSVNFVKKKKNLKTTPPYIVPPSLHGLAVTPYIVPPSLHGLAVTPYIVPLSLHCLAVGTKFDTFYFQIFY